MRSFEIGEQEPIPNKLIVEVAALRPNSASEAARWRRSLPNVLAGVVGEVPGAELELVLFTDEDGIVGIEVIVSAGESTAAVAGEMAAALAPVAETIVHETFPSTRIEWPVLPIEGRAPLGFAAGSTSVPVTAMRWKSVADKASEQLIEQLAGLPGQGVRVRLREAAGVEPRWEVQMHAVTDGDVPSLRLRAAVRRRFAGLQVGGEQGCEPVWLQVSSIDLPELFGLPVAADEPLTGARTAPAAPIPLAPPKRGTTAAGSGLRIGHAVTGGGRPVPVELSVEERLRHVHVLGRTGTGKSSALAGIVHGVGSSGEGALIVDPHGTLCDRILAELPSEARERAWVIRCGDVENPVPINPLAEKDPVRRDIAIADLCETFQYLFDKRETGIVGPRFQERVAMTLRALAAVHGTRASLLDVPFASADDTFMAAAVAESGDDRLKTWWATNKLESRSNEHGQVLAWVNSKFHPFSSTAALRAILGSGAHAIDFAAAMDEGRIILLDLSKAQIGEAASRLLGFLYLGRIWDAALRRTRRGRPFTVIVDEAHTLFSGALTNMLTEGRKFGLSVVIAHQYLEQLDEDLRPAVDGNVATTIAFRCAVADAIEIRKRFGGLVDTSTLVTLPDLTAVSLRTAMSGPAYPHSLLIDHNSRVTARGGAELELHSLEILIASCVDLVDPFRKATAAAAAGTSNIEAIPLPTDVRKARSLLEAPKPGPAPALKSSGDQPTELQKDKMPSVLDDWLAKRLNAARSGAAKAETDGDPAKPDSSDRQVVDVDQLHLEIDVAIQQGVLTDMDQKNTGQQ